MAAGVLIVHGTWLAARPGRHRRLRQRQGRRTARDARLIAPLATLKIMWAETGYNGSPRRN